LLTAPLTDGELAAALEAIGGFEARPLIAVAVSGGPDSLALIILADRWARQRGGEAWALTVDHGLRPESAEEARTVAGWLTDRCISHETLVWAGAKPQSGIQEAAREARYRLLGQWCRAHGVLHLLTAHHREDQVETYLIRRRAGSGIDGLAGMSAVRELAGCRLVRPLLSVPRARLLAVLKEEDQPFLSDPSNLDPAFERARLRAAATPVPQPAPGAVW
jgi:tRNA(Ile)-lysidine synthase